MLSASCHPPTLTFTQSRDISIFASSAVGAANLTQGCSGGFGTAGEEGGMMKKSGRVMCGWLEIISQTLKGVVLPSLGWRLLGNSIFYSRLWVVTRLP